MGRLSLGEGKSVLLPFFGQCCKTHPYEKMPIQASFRRNVLRVLLFFVDHDDLLAILIAAMLAYAVRQLHLVALFALDDRGKFQLPVRATGTAAGLGYFSFGQSHNYTS